MRQQGVPEEKCKAPHIINGVNKPEGRMRALQQTFFTVIVKRPVAAISEGGLLIVHVRFSVCSL